MAPSRIFEEQLIDQKKQQLIQRNNRANFKTDLEKYFNFYLLDKGTVARQNPNLFRFRTMDNGSVVKQFCFWTLSEIWTISFEFWMFSFWEHDSTKQNLN